MSEINKHLHNIHQELLLATEEFEKLTNQPNVEWYQDVDSIGEMVADMMAIAGVVGAETKVGELTYHCHESKKDYSSLQRALIAESVRAAKEAGNRVSAGDSNNGLTNTVSIFEKVNGKGSGPSWIIPETTLAFFGNQIMFVKHMPSCYRSEVSDILVSGVKNLMEYSHSENVVPMTVFELQELIREY